ncbi:MAG: mechanosensitive ion channel family protein [Microcoleaceae cyanobacterium]
MSIPLASAQQALPSDINPVTSVIRVGNLISAPVVVDGVERFRVAMKIMMQSNQEGQNISIKQRAKLIENEIHGILENQLYGGGLAKGFNPDTLGVFVSKREGKTQIFASDYDQLRERAIMLVTPEDAEYNGYSVDIWAVKLTEVIETTLLEGYQQRQPVYLYRASLWSFGIVLTSALLTFMAYLLHKRLFKQKLIIGISKRKFDLTQAQSNENSISLNNRIKNTAANNKQQYLKRKFNKNQYQILLLKFVMILIWSITIWKITDVFPKTRFFSVWLSRSPFFLLLIIIFVGLAIRITTWIIDYLLNTFRDNYSPATIIDHRRELRFSTYSIVFKGVSKVIWITLGFLAILDTLEIPVAPVIAGLGIIGLALSFGSQNLIRDLLHGIFILFEDHYAVGDYITIGETSGYVEYMNLRITQIRGKEGRLTTLQNGTITTVHNQTKDWARVDFRPIISYESDIDMALYLMRNIIEEMSLEPEWKSYIIDPVITLGVDNFTDYGVELIIKIKTRPDFQWQVGREFRRRLKYTFDREGILFGNFRQAIHMSEMNQN